MTTAARTAVAALEAAYGAVTELVSGLAEADFARPTGCAYWALDALLFHQMLDAQRALIALAAPGDAPADTGAVSYWQAYAAEAVSDEQLTEKAAQFATRGAGAYGGSRGLVLHWTDVSEAAVAAAARSDPDLTVSTQGLRLRTDDFLESLVVEATIHHLDLTRELADAVAPAPANLALTRHTLEGLLGRPAPAHWDDTETVLRLTGRAEIPAADVSGLGAAMDRVPVIH
jgi:Mycothiol maleylpyruvate isomerase N-terminal domain